MVAVSLTNNLVKAESANESSGFTLVELLVVIAIMAVLLAVAIPNYSNFMAKSKFSELTRALAPYKLAAELAVQGGVSNLNGLTAGSNGIPSDITVNNHYKYVATIQMKDGVLSATSKDIKEGENLNYILRASIINNRLVWSVDEDSTCLSFSIC